MPTVETLPLLLKQLRLPTMSRHWHATAQQAEEQHWTYPEYLSTLVDLEATARYDIRLCRYLKAAHLPPNKALDTFDFKATPSLNPAHIKALCETPDWARNAENVILLGPSGVGKTHLAASIGYSLIQHGMRILFTNATQLVQDLQRARAEYRLPQALDRLSRFQVLIVDDIAYVKNSEMETSVLFELIADRYETASLVLTANESFGGWDKIFPNQMMAVAAVDRLVHHATIINITGDSYRKRKSIEQHKARSKKK